MVLDHPTWLRILVPLRLSTIAIRHSRRPRLYPLDVLCLSRERMDGQQSLSQRPPAAERGAPGELLTGMMKWEEGRTWAKGPAAFTQKESGCWALGERPCRSGALDRARLALNEVFMCAPVFEFLCWSFSTVWGNNQGNPHLPSVSIS